MTKAKPKIWVLTYEVNDYDQHDEYFIAAFAEMPTLEQLAEFMKDRPGLPTHNIMEAVAFLEHLRKGGGRKSDEQIWYNFNKVDLL